MLPLFVFIQNFITDASDRLKNEVKGATAVEYGLLIGLIAVVLIAGLVLLGPAIRDLFSNVAGRLPTGL